MNALQLIDRQPLKQSIVVWNVLEKRTQEFIKWVIRKEFFLNLPEKYQAIIASYKLFIILEFKYIISVCKVITSAILKTKEPLKEILMILQPWN